MKIQVSCFATLSKYAPDDGNLDIEKGDTPESVFKKLSIPSEEVKVIFVNGQSSKRDTLLKENDRLGIFPAIGGG
ncbi:MAG: MoaD/ThiS family protein [Desulfonatronovibrio sp. MSAO_Bac4]|nr:MAG: MoaD/ThiS family protein [Desulfonatronovibrio sp. MSAO_Bac4]